MRMMPEMDGIDTYAEMRKLENSLNKDTPVIMLPANAVSGAREEDWYFIGANHVSFLHEYRLAVSAIKKAFHIDP